MNKQQGMKTVLTLKLQLRLQIIFFRVYHEDTEKIPVDGCPILNVNINVLNVIMTSRPLCERLTYVQFRSWVFWVTRKLFTSNKCTKTILMKLL